MLRELSGMQLKPGCIVTDVGSTKASVAAIAREVQLEGCVFHRWTSDGRDLNSPVLKRHPFIYSRMHSMSSTPEVDAPQSEVDKLN